MVETIDMVDLVAKGLAAYNGRDMATALDLLHPDFELFALRSLIDGTPYCGHSGYRKFLADMAEEWESWSLVLEELRQVASDRVVVLARFVGHARASGIEVDSPGVWVVTVQDGLVRTIRAHSDQQRALTELGLER